MVRAISITLVFLCCGFSLVTAQTNYKLFFETGVNVFDPHEFQDSTLISIKFSSNFSQGISIKNAYFGIGIGYSKFNDSIFFLPVEFNFKFTFTGKTAFLSTDPQNGVNLYYFLNIGKTFDVSRVPTNQEISGFTISTGIGFLIGVLKDVKFVISMGYRLQHLRKDIVPKSLDFFQGRLGISYTI